MQSIAINAKLRVRMFRTVVRLWAIEVSLPILFAHPLIVNKNSGLSHAFAQSPQRHRRAGRGNGGRAAGRFALPLLAWSYQRISILIE
jgi:hypothetical protein